MSRSRSRSAIGWSSGLFQAPSYLLPQLVAAIALSLGWSETGLGWIAPLGYLGPLVVSLVMASGDVIGGRKLILGTAALASVGVAFIALGGFLNELGIRGPAIAAVVAGVCLIPLAFRHGALVTGHQTFGLHADDQLRESRALRRYLVLGRYVVPLPAVLISLWLGWWVVFALLAVLQLRALALLRRRIDDRRATRNQLEATDGSPKPSLWLLWPAFGAFLTQFAVFTYVSGMPVVLAGVGLDGWKGAVLSAAVLAALFVKRPKRMTSPRFGRLAGAVPVTGLLVVVLLGLAVGPQAEGGFHAGVLGVMLFVVGFAGLSVVMELANQWGQSLAPLQARAGGGLTRDYRRRAVVEFSANLGPPAGFVLGQHVGHTWAHAWLWLLLLLLGLAAAAWAVGASWFVAFPYPWRVGDLGDNKMRVCVRGREYIVDTTTVSDSQGSMDAVQRTAVYPAARRGDDVHADRPLMEFDPSHTTLAAELARLPHPPGAIKAALRSAWGTGKRMVHACALRIGSLPRGVAVAFVSHALAVRDDVTVQALAESVARCRERLMEGAPVEDDPSIAVRAAALFEGVAGLVLERRAKMFVECRATRELVSHRETAMLLAESERLRQLQDWMGSLGVAAPSWLRLDLASQHVRRQLGLVDRELARRSQPHPHTA